MAAASLLKLPAALEHYLISFVSPTDYLALTSTCKRWRQWRDPSHACAHSLVVQQCILFSWLFDHRRNVLMHGPGGCGKTTLLQALQAYASKHPEAGMVFTSTTANSALNIPTCQTLHSFAGLGKANIQPAALERKLDEARLKRSMSSAKYVGWRKVKYLVVDEVSMMSANMLTLCDLMARYSRNRLIETMGGVILLLVGDFLQLQPVADRHVFESPVWNQLQLRALILRTPLRQLGDSRYSHMLQRVRFGRHTPDDVRIFQSRLGPLNLETTMSIVRRHNQHARRFVSPVMYSTQKQVVEHNKLVFDSIEHPVTVQRQAEDQYFRREKRDGRDVNVRIAAPPPSIFNGRIMQQANTRLPELVALKPGAQYILTYNYNLKKGLVNGSSAIYVEEANPNVPGGREGVLHFKHQQRVPATDLLRTDQFYSLVRNSSTDEMQMVMLCRTQLPLRLGYAITIHASQGMTFDTAVADLGTKLFQPAQMYVALSRVRTLQGLQLTNFNLTPRKHNPHMLQFVEQLENHGTTQYTPAPLPAPKCAVPRGRKPAPRVPVADLSVAPTPALPVTPTATGAMTGVGVVSATGALASAAAVRRLPQWVRDGIAAVAARKRRQPDKVVAVNAAAGDANDAATEMSTIADRVCTRCKVGTCRDKARMCHACYSRAGKRASETRRSNQQQAKQITDAVAAVAATAPAPASCIDAVPVADSDL